MRGRLSVLFTVILCAMPFGASAQRVSVWDYEVPVSTAAQLLLNVKYDYEQIDGTTLTNDGALDLHYSLFYESLPFAYSLDVVGAGSRIWFEDRAVYAYRTHTTGRIKRYVSDRYALFGSIAGRGDYMKGDMRPATNVTLGIGWGRFINATALRKAVRIDDFFLADGVTKDRLPKETMLEIANIIERQEEYRKNYGRATFKSYWYDDIEHAVKASGLLAGETLGAVGVLRMEEVLFRENIGDRFVGYDITLGVKYDLTLSESGMPRPAPGADLTLRYARPVGWSTQVDLQASLSSPMEQGVFGRVYRLNSVARFLYEVTNRIDFRTDYQLILHKDRGRPAAASHSILPSFLFYIENEVRLLVGLRFEKPAGELWTEEVSIGLNYKAF